MHTEPRRCLQPSTGCLQVHPERVLPGPAADRLMLALWAGTHVYSASNALPNLPPPAPRHLREVRMTAYVDPFTDCWRWALEVWQDGRKATHDYPAPPTEQYRSALAALELAEAAGA